MMNEVRRFSTCPYQQPEDGDNRIVENISNLSLLNDYNVYLSVEKGLRPLTCEAYLSDLRIFAEFLEGREGVLLKAAEEDVAAFLEHLRACHGIRPPLPEFEKPQLPRQDPRPLGRAGWGAAGPPPARAGWA